MQMTDWTPTTDLLHPNLHISTTPGHSYTQQPHGQAITADSWGPGTLTHEVPPGTHQPLRESLGHAETLRPLSLLFSHTCYHRPGVWIESAIQSLRLRIESLAEF